MNVVNKVNYLSIQDKKANRDINILKKKIQKMEKVVKSKNWDKQQLKRAKILNYFNCIEKHKKLQQERAERIRKKEDAKKRILEMKKVT